MLTALALALHLEIEWRVWRLEQGQAGGGERAWTYLLPALSGGGGSVPSGAEASVATPAQLRALSAALLDDNTVSVCILMLAWIKLLQASVGKRVGREGERERGKEGVRAPG